MTSVTIANDTERDDGDEFGILGTLNNSRRHESSHADK